MHLFAIGCAAGGLVVLLAACGASPEPGASTSRPGSVSATAQAPQTNSPTPSPSGVRTPVSPSSDSTYLPAPEPEVTVPATRLGRLERLTGVVGHGVEGGCLLLTPGGSGRALHLLVEDDRVVEGTRVTVEGYRAEGMASTCQEGVPFTVTKVVDIGPTGN